MFRFRFRLRFPLVRRSRLDAATAELRRSDRRLIEANEYTSDLRGGLKTAAVRMSRAEDDAERARQHLAATVKAKDDAYLTLDAERWRQIWELRTELDRLIGEVDSLGILTPFDWAAPVPPTANTVVVADIHGTRGTIAGLPDDPASDDPRRNMSLPMGLSATDFGERRR